MADPVIRIEQASKSFGGFQAVRAVSLEVNAGDIFGLIGKSGAGKSTLLRLINLLERPDFGTVTVDGSELTSLSRRELREARANIGMIFQQFNLLQNATVFDNIAFPLRIHGVQAPTQIASRVHDCLELVGLNDKHASYPAQLSGGQKQRVAIARALASKPAVLLCDEPTSALDAETTRSLLSTLKDINRRLGVTIVIVSHELDVIGAICNRVAVLEDGAIAEQFALGATGPRKTALGRELAAAVSATSATEPAALPATATPAPDSLTAASASAASAADASAASAAKTLAAASAINALAAIEPVSEAAHV